MTRSTSLLALLLLITGSSSADATKIQFGGNSTLLSDVNFQSQIGASQIIQWNGVNSDGGSFGASGNLSGPSGASAGEILNSLGSESLVLTSRVISTTDTNGATFASGTPNILGVGGDNASNDDAKFDANFNESWSFDFNRDVILEHLVFSALGFNGETIELTLEGNSPVSFNRTDPKMALVTYGPTTGRYVYTPASGGVSISAGDDITVGSTQGVWGLQGVVVSVTVIPEPSSIAFICLITMFTHVFRASK